ncbi:hypothetical protein, partial [Bordetella holmesii]|uniref:hypothetical protein n=1 Tax=Bordetella holmesii TaxID=35814 RepID=UPI001A99358B
PDRVAWPRQRPGCIFGHGADDTRRPFEELPDTELDEQGRGEIRVDPQAADAHSPMTVRLSGSLLEAGGRPVVRSIERN